MFLKDVLMLLAVSLESRLQRIGFYARTVTLKLTFHNMKSITRSQSGENTNLAHEIFMAAFKQFQEFQLNDAMLKIPIRLIGISLQNLSFSGSRQLTFSDACGNRERQMKTRWQDALSALERKYRIKIMTDRREDLYDAIEAMKNFSHQLY